MAVSKGWKGFIDGFGVEVKESQTLKEIFMKEAPDATQAIVQTKDGRTQVKRVEDLSQVPEQEVESVYSNVVEIEKGNHQ
jgi:hypothetical protein